MSETGRSLVQRSIKKTTRPAHDRLAIANLIGDTLKKISEVELHS
jgi:hypothetical protein